MNTTLLAALLPLLSAGPMPPPPPASPLLFVRIAGPAGSRVTFHAGTPAARAFESGVVAGFRPGYYYRVQLTNLPGEPGATISPSLEVLNTLHVPPPLRAEDYPATLTLTGDDVRRILNGVMVTKVVYLEDPLKAAPVESADKPIELEVLPGGDPLAEARLRGRPCLIVRIGERDVPPQELAALDVPGTVLLPGEPGLPPAACPPMIPAAKFQTFDPILGPRYPLEEIVIDGDDLGPRVGIDPNGRLGGFGATDTAVEFRYGDGAKRVTTSNRVCLFAPRFVTLVQSAIPAGYDTLLATGNTLSSLEQTSIQTLLPPQVVNGEIAAALTRSREGVRGIHTRLGLQALDKYQGGPLIVGTAAGTQVTGAVREVESATLFQDKCKPDQPLVLTKYAEPKAVHAGDIVTFVLKYENYGNKVVRDVAISDSLSPRLEYVPGSCKADRNVVLTFAPNEAGSLALRWDVTGDLQPGQGGLISFQAKVR
jgi:uncharacterized repeat protein (TIGR01451 family)